jgi:hypothetical protein
METNCKNKLQFSGKPLLRQNRKFSALCVERFSLRSRFIAHKNYAELVRIDQVLGDFCES